LPRAGAALRSDLADAERPDPDRADDDRPDEEPLDADRSDAAGAGRGGATSRSDSSMATCITLIGLRISLSMARRRGRSELSHKDVAMPVAPARPVRPIRCT